MIKSTFKKLRGNQLAKSVVFYTILGFFVKGISFLITPLFTHYIEPGDFGNLNLYLSTINFITPIILASTNSINSDYFKISKEELSKRISSYWIFSVFLSGALTLLVLIFSNKLTHFFSFNTFYIAMLPLMCICTLMIDTGFIVFRNENKNKSISLYTILKIVIELGLSLIFIVYYKHGVIGRLNAFIISNLVLGAFLFVFTNRHFKLKLAFNSNHIKNEFKYWLSILVGFLFVISFSIIDKYIIKQNCDTTEFGNYTLVSQFGFIILTLTSAISSAYTPVLFRELTNNTPKSRILKTHYAILFLIAITALCSIGFVYLLFKFYISYKYAAAWQYYWIVAAVYAIWSMITITFNFLYYFKLNKIIFIYGILAVLILLPAEYLAGVYYKISGLLYVQLIYMIVFFSSLNFILKNKYKINNA